MIISIFIKIHWKDFSEKFSWNQEKFTPLFNNYKVLFYLLANPNYVLFVTGNKETD